MAKKHLDLSSEKVLDSSREIVQCDYYSATMRNQELYLLGDIKAGSEYIYTNQKEDALAITDKFYTTPIRVISIVKRTKVGMDGLMIEIAKNMTTHPDNKFVLHRNNVFFITAMSNVSWEDDMKDKIPTCFKDNVFHHGKLQRLKSKLKKIKNAIIINDEIDTGDKEDQKLHLVLKDSGVLDMKYMEDNNIRFIFVSATMINELRDLYLWGDKHATHYMSIPDSYIGIFEFLKLGIIKDYYPVIDEESAERWIAEDIIDKYGSDYRVHIIRTDEKYKDYICDACARNGIIYKNHTSVDRISHEELSEIFDNIREHVVIAVKGFYRRANLIPNAWKLKIGAVHERYVKNYDTNVQVQGLPGRMTGYWKHEIMNGWITGPYRTSIAAILEYEEFYKNPHAKIRYSIASSKKLFMNPKNIKNLKIIDAPESAIAIEHVVLNQRVPVVITGISLTDIIFTTKKRAEKVAYVITLLRRMPEYAKLLKFIQNPGVQCAQISRPNVDLSYRKNVLDVISAYSKNSPFTIALKDKDKAVNNWQLFIYLK